MKLIGSIAMQNRHRTSREGEASLVPGCSTAAKNIFYDQDLKLSDDIIENNA
jgi:hypothetical protein